jgi:CRISPR-associated protein Cas2
MMLIILENVPISLRGELSRWMLEPKPGVFVGDVSAVVRNELWKKCQKNIGNGGVLQIWSMNTEQGFAMRAFGDTKREIIDTEGLQLIRVPSG